VFLQRFLHSLRPKCRLSTATHAYGSKPDPAGLEAKKWGSITKIAWKEEMPGMPVLSEKGAKSRAINLCNYLLNCEIEKPEGLKSEGDEN
jgi:hypothetical protein